MDPLVPNIALVCVHIAYFKLVLLFLYPECQAFLYTPYIKQAYSQVFTFVVAISTKKDTKLNVVQTFPFYRCKLIIPV